MIVDIEKSFKAKVRAIAQTSKRNPADLWQNLMIERLLARLEQSHHSKYFVLKGAILLSKYIDIKRETRDLDFLAHSVSNDINDLKTYFEEISSIDVQDGFKFSHVTATALRHPHMDYPGATITLVCHFGKTRSKVSIDIGFGDIVASKLQTINLMRSYKGPLFESSVSLNCYPIEFIFAEKLETLVFRGSINSRMKDFHDLYSMISYSSDQPFVQLEAIIRDLCIIQASHKNQRFLFRS